jgi:ABC-type sugar transport system permease subunit
MVYNLIVIIFFSLFIALLLNRKFAMRGAVRAIFFIPVIMATAAITSSLDQLLAMMMGGVQYVSEEVQNSMGSGFNAMAVAFLLLDFGMPPQFIEYIIDALASLYMLIRSSGVQILIFLAALQAIPGSLYEVAQIEGATAYESFWKITFPMVSPLILTNVVYTMVDTFSTSDVVQMAYGVSFSSFNFGMGAAMSLIGSLAACLVLLVFGFGISKYIYYQT